MPYNALEHTKNCMPTLVKRILFWGLITFFLINTIIIYTMENDSVEAKKKLTEDAKSGKLVFQKYNCVACHQLYGLGGYMGPDLTNVMSQKGKGIMYAKSFMQSGTQRMPNFHLNEKELNDLLAFLTYVDKTGISPLRNFELQYDGTVKSNELR